MCGLILCGSRSSSCQLDNSKTTIVFLSIFGSFSKTDARILPAKDTLYLVFNNCAVSVAVVDFPLVPVIPIMFLEGQSSKNNPISVSVGILYFLAIFKYSEFQGTPGFLIIKSAFLKSPSLCLPNM